MKILCILILSINHLQAFALPTRYLEELDQIDYDILGQIRPSELDQLTLMDQVQVLPKFKRMGVLRTPYWFVAANQQPAKPRKEPIKLTERSLNHQINERIYQDLEISRITR